MLWGKGSSRHTLSLASLNAEFAASSSRTSYTRLEAQRDLETTLNLELLLQPPTGSAVGGSESRRLRRAARF